MTQPPIPPIGPNPFEFLKSLWGPLGLPMAGMVTPTPDAGDLDKRIAELKSVESWLNLNLNILRMTIQGLEMQKVALTAMSGITTSARAMQNAMKVPPAGVAPSSGLPGEAWWTLLQQAQQTAAQALNQADERPAKKAPGKKR